MGERQFVSGARAVLVNPVIVLLDETMASVNSCNEHLIQKAMGRMLNRRTALIIAHRLSTIRNANRIIVLDKGKIVAEGNHEQLLTHDGLYARLYEISNAGLETSQ